MNDAKADCADVAEYKGLEDSRSSTSVAYKFISCESGTRLKVGEIKVSPLSSEYIHH